MKTILLIPDSKGAKNGYYSTIGYSSDPEKELKHVYLGKLVEDGWQIKQINHWGELILEKPYSYGGAYSLFGF
jgi:hypothetical protein